MFEVILQAEYGCNNLPNTLLTNTDLSVQPLSHSSSLATNITSVGLTSMAPASGAYRMSTPTPMYLTTTIRTRWSILPMLRVWSSRSRGWILMALGRRSLRGIMPMVLKASLWTGLASEYLNWIWILLKTFLLTCYRTSNQKLPKTLYCDLTPRQTNTITCIDNVAYQSNGQKKVCVQITACKT